MPDRRVFATAVACVLCVATSIRVRGAEAEFTLDPAASRFTVGGSIDGRTLGDQTPGSTTTAVTGTLFLDIDRTAGTVSLVRGLPRLELQPQPQRPHRDMPGPGPAVFGMAAGPDTDPLLASIASMSVAFGLDDAPYNGRPPRRFEEFFFGVNDGSLYYT